MYEVSSSGLNHKLISFWAASTESDPWQTLRPISTKKSPRMVPGLESLGLVSPNITRPVLTTPVPCQTMGTTGPLAMYLTNPQDSRPGTIRGDYCVEIGRPVCHGSDSA